MQAPAHHDRRPSNDERRARRSDDTMTALHYQLAFARHEGGFEALVLADSSGCLVAGAGAWPTCEMLALPTHKPAVEADWAETGTSTSESPSESVNWRMPA